ncbi:MAG: helix-hairpin-helix domain-containing protein, partial [Fidelibacterota bacterium]
MLKKYLPLIINTLILAFSHVSPIMAQNEIEENLLENQLSEADETTELLEYFRENPLSINDASSEELEKIPGLDNHLSEKIVVLRRKKGGFSHLSDILEIEEITPERFEFLSNFLILRRAEGNFKFRTRLRTGEKGELYIYNRFLYKGSNGTLMGGLTEKDRMEKDLLDFFSFFICSGPTRFWDKLILGHYNPEFGQGLTLWNNRGFSKGIEVTDSIEKRGRGLIPSISAGENSSLRGMALQKRISIYTFFFFISKTGIDAAKRDSKGGAFTLQKSGIHVSPSQIKAKGALKEGILGGRMKIKLNEAIKIGFSFYRDRYDNPVLLSEGDDSVGLSSFKTGGFDFRIIKAASTFFGEIAGSNGSKGALLAGVISRQKIFTIAMLVRYYHPNFISPHGFGFGERNGYTKNEAGVYMAASIYPQKGMKGGIYFDLYRFLRPYALKTPILWGDDILIFLRKKINRNLKAGVKLKLESSEKILKGKDIYGRESKYFSKVKRSDGRIWWEHKISKSLRIRWRIDSCIYNPGDKREYGYSWFSEVKYSPTADLMVNYRFSVFQTDSYDSRIYQFEGDLPGTGRNTPLHGRGIKWYLLIKKRFHKDSTVSL